MNKAELIAAVAENAELTKKMQKLLKHLSTLLQTN